MKVDGRHFRSIWLEQDGWSVGAIDQRRLPHEFVIARLETAEAAADAIRSMLVRGAPLIGATAAYGMGGFAGHYAPALPLEPTREIWQRFRGGLP